MNALLLNWTTFILIWFSSSLLVAQVASVPEAIREKADEYIIGLVGEDYFKKNYRYSEDVSKKSSSRNGDDFFINYTYQPLISLDVPKPYVHVRISQGRILDQYSYVVQKNAGNIVEPKITKSQVFEKLTREYPRINFSKASIAMWFPNWMQNWIKGWIWRLDISWPTREGSLCQFDQTYYVDASYGEIKQLPVGESCE